MDTGAATTYTADLFVDILKIDYEQQGNRWIDALQDALQKAINEATGFHLQGEQATPEFPYPHYKLTVNGLDTSGEVHMAVPLDTPSLAIAPVQIKGDGIGLYVALLSKRPINDDDRQIWSNAINEAVEALSKENTEFAWTAAITQAGARHHGPILSLKKREVIDGLVLRSGGQQYVAHKRSQPSSFLSFGWTISWPIVLEGRAIGYDWPVASRQAAADIHKTVTLLSLAWNTRWELIQTPRPMVEKLKVPPSDSPIMSHSRHSISPRVPKVIPKWVLSAWNHLDGDEKVRNALNAHYEGLSLMEDHPSFALVAFIASVEIIGKKIVGRKVGTNQRFRAGVDQVISNRDKAEEIYALYKRRSGTAHDGMLHGDEDLPGVLPIPGIFGGDTKDLFIFSDLQTMRVVSRSLLIKSLRGKVRFAS